MKIKRTIFTVFLVALGAALTWILYAGFFGWNISSAPYSPPTPPELVGVLAPNSRLASAEVIAKAEIIRGEDVAIDKEGRLYSGSNEDGKVYRVTSTDAGWKTEVFADMGIMPIGLIFDREGNLIVCHEMKGLVSVSPDGKATVLTDSVEGEPFGFIDDVDIAPDRKIYFSDASTKFNRRNGNLGWEHEMLDSRAYGRLIVYDPADRSTKVLLRDLYFANGIAVSQDGSYVLVNETARTRIARYWLTGEKAGTSDIYADNLPGYPDGILKDDERGGFWVGMPAKREALVEAILPHPFLKNVISAFPKSLWARSAKYGLVVRIVDGKITETLQDPSGSVHSISNVVEHAGYLYLASFKGDSLWRVKL